VADGCREFKHHLDGRVSQHRPVEADADVCLDTPFVREIVRGAAVVFEVLDIGDTQLPGGVEHGGIVRKLGRRADVEFKPGGPLQRW
jgi:hypothetical protein